MPRRKRSVSPNCDFTDDDFEDDFSPNGTRHPPGQRNAANARERARMRILSSAFCRLKTKLPWVPPDTKLSKLDTLRLATTYIQQLGALLAGEAERVDSSMPHNLTWPFHFQQPPDQKPNNPSPELSSPLSSSSSSPEQQWNNHQPHNHNHNHHQPQQPNHHHHHLVAPQEIPLTHFRDINTSVYNSVLHGQ